MPRVILSSSAKPVIELDGRAVVYFGGTNYLGLSYNENVILAAQEGLIKWGISSAGSRETTGGAIAHEQLEIDLAQFLQRKSVITCCSGYMVNLILLQALRARYNVCLLDDGAHCSVKDAVAGSMMPAETFHHGDMDGLESRLRSYHSQNKTALICTDGVLSSGDLAPIAQHQELARKWDAAVVVDDAHGIGVLGENGRGTIEHLGLTSERIYQTGTLSKAFGCFGGFAAGDEPFGDMVRTTSEAYIGSTPLPPALACAALVSIELVANDSTLRKNLARNIALMKSSLHSLGIETNQSPSPIATFVLGPREHNEEIHSKLLEENILIPYNFYPGGPEEGFFRMVVTARHSPEQINRATETLGILIAG